jgi:hypothetical protein
VICSARHVQLPLERVKGFKLIDSEIVQCFLVLELTLNRLKPSRDNKTGTFESLRHMLFVVPAVELLIVLRLDRHRYGHYCSGLRAHINS